MQFLHLCHICNSIQKYFLHVFIFSAEVGESFALLDSAAPILINVTSSVQRDFCHFFLFCMWQKPQFLELQLKSKFKHICSS